MWWGGEWEVLSPEVKYISICGLPKNCGSKRRFCINLHIQTPNFLHISPSPIPEMRFTIVTSTQNLVSVIESTLNTITAAKPKCEVSGFLGSIWSFGVERKCESVYWFSVDNWLLRLIGGNCDIWVTLRSRLVWYSMASQIWGVLGIQINARIRIWGRLALTRTLPAIWCCYNTSYVPSYVRIYLITYISKFRISSINL